MPSSRRPASQPDVFGRQAREVAAHDLDEEELAQAREHAFAARALGRRLRQRELDEARSRRRSTGRGAVCGARGAGRRAAGLKGRASQPRKPQMILVALGPAAVHLDARAGSGAVAACRGHVAPGGPRMPGALDITCASPCGKTMTSPASAGRRSRPRSPPARARRDHVVLDDVFDPRHDVRPELAGGRRFGDPGRGGVDREEHGARQAHRAQHFRERRCSWRGPSGRSVCARTLGQAPTRRSWETDGAVILAPARRSYNEHSRRRIFSRAQSGEQP